MHDENQVQVSEFTSLRAQFVFAGIFMIPIGGSWVVSLYAGSAEAIVGSSLLGALMLCLVTGNRTVSHLSKKESCTSLRRC